MPAIVKVTIYERTISAHFFPGGAVYQKGSGLGRRAQDAARELAPKRTGRLAASITHGIAPRGRFNTIVNLHMSASYGPYVEHGTVGPIRPVRGKAMTIPPFGEYEGFLAASVSGQVGQHFLARGMNQALSSFGYGSVAED